MNSVYRGFIYRKNLTRIQTIGTLRIETFRGRSYQIRRAMGLSPLQCSRTLKYRGCLYTK